MSKPTQPSTTNETVSKNTATAKPGENGNTKKTSIKNRILMAIGVVIMLMFGGYYLFGGEDPLGLFGPKKETPVPSTPLPDGESGGAWWQVYFSTPNVHNDPNNLAGTIPETLIAHINEAKNTIHIASFEFNLTPVAEALIAAHKRGVDVRWVTDDEYGIDADEEDDHGQFEMLGKAGIDIRDDGRRGLMHNKFWIFDEQIVWTGSTNITKNGTFRNNNNVIVLRSTKVAEIYEREFMELWTGKLGTTSPSTVEQQSVIVDGTPVQVLFAAEDEVASHLVPMIEKAKKRIRFMAFSFTHDGIGNAVMARADAGIDVKGIFEKRASETEYSELQKFYCAGISVRQDGNPGILHHKVFMIDDKMVITGSYNFSNNADESNDENVVVVTNADIAALYLQEFESRWLEAQVPPKADMKCK